MSIQFIIEKVILGKEKPFTEEDIINDKRLKLFQYKKTIIHSIISGYISDGIIEMEGYKYKINKKKVD